jgi:hypothetical protein
MSSSTAMGQGRIGQGLQADGGDMLRTGAGDQGLNVPIRVLATGRT